MIESFSQIDPQDMVLLLHDRSHEFISILNLPDEITVDLQTISTGNTRIFKLEVKTFEKSYDYCLSLKNISLLNDKAINYVKEHLAHYLVPIYFAMQAEIKESNLLLELIPFYQSGTLMAACDLSRFMNKEVFDDYYDLTKFMFFRHRYLSSHKEAVIDLQRLNKVREVSYDSYRAARRALKKPLSSFFKARKDTLPAEHLELTLKVMHEMHPQAQFAEQELPKSRPSSKLLTRIREGYDFFKHNVDGKLQTMTVGPLHMEAIKQQQQFLLNILPKIITLLHTIEGAQLHFYDFKPDNLLLDEQDIRISDYKTFVPFIEQANGFYACSDIDYMPPEYFSSNIPDFLSKTQAKQFTQYQLGATLYNLAVGIPAHKFDKTQRLAVHLFFEKGRQLNLSHSFNFDIPCFNTVFGQFLKECIIHLAHLNPCERMSLAEFEQAFEEYLYRNKINELYQSSVPSHLML
ncbi:MAG: hypothetical protein CMF38_00525 [Legionellaceae bacterium]|nr:hypothetical protein [Legionellaceae bacterium]